MPYDNQFADKTAHSTLLRNPDVRNFLSSCDYIRQPNEEDKKLVMAAFQVGPDTAEITPPRKVLAIDGSFHISAVHSDIPSTTVGFLQFGTVLVNLDQMAASRDRHGRIDHFQFAQATNSSAPLHLVLPGSNLRIPGIGGARLTFRMRLQEFLAGEATRFDPTDDSTGMLATLAAVASDADGSVTIQKCPTCSDDTDTVIPRGAPAAACGNCGASVFVSDRLRAWELVQEHTVQETVFNRLQNAIERLLAIHYVRHLHLKFPQALSGLAIILDGPLAIYGEPAKLHRGIMRCLKEVNRDLIARGQLPVMMLGLIKTGSIVDYATLIARALEKDKVRNRLLCVDDAFRDKWILQEEPGQRATGFGEDTHFGQDFIYHTPTGRTFVFAMPYPDGEKTSGFHTTKADIRRYPRLHEACALIHHCETALYRNAVIPVALAHKYSSISLRPGGRVLDLLAKQTVGKGPP